MLVAQRVGFFMAFSLLSALCFGQQESHRGAVLHTSYGGYEIYIPPQEHSGKSAAGRYTSSTNCKIKRN